MNIANVWVSIGEFYVTSYSKRTYYLKYLSPNKYSHLRDHVRNTILPLHVELKDFKPQLDSTFIELIDGKAPVFAGLSFEVEELSFLPEGAEMNVEDSGFYT